MLMWKGGTAQAIIQKHCARLVLGIPYSTAEPQIQTQIEAFTGGGGVGGGSGGVATAAAAAAAAATSTAATAAADYLHINPNGYLVADEPDQQVYHEKLSDSMILSNRGQDKQIFDETATINYSNLKNTEIYCHGRLLHTIQMAQLYTDSKTFVDKKLKLKPNETLERFEDLMLQTDQQPSRKQIEDFVNDHFEDGNELEAWHPPDWTERPKFTDTIVDPNYKEWALQLNQLWTNLTRKMRNDVKDNPEQYSIVYVPNGLVVPGGRFTEFYYWDSFWILRGLLLSEMRDTARGILLNFLSMVQQYGFVPNGGRIYYLQRSQPPLLTPMVESYYEATGDRDFLDSNIDLLEREFNFWMTNRCVDVAHPVTGKTYKLARYFAPSTGPRPESYSEDFHSAAFLQTEVEREDLYVDLKSAAESGWDFSSRWFITNKTNQGNISSIHTRYIIPVDLNAFIYWNARIISRFFSDLGQVEKSEKYTRLADKWLEAVTAILWHEDLGVWLDYDLRNNVRREYFYPSNLAPLWTDCYDPAQGRHISDAVLAYLDRINIMDFIGGLPASLELTGEQWDRPNAWPPLQIMAIQGLEKIGQRYNDEATRLAREMARNWLYSNYKGFAESKEMFEKYDAENPGRYGGGGEYIVQAGFGWTNGVIMELLNTYGREITCEDPAVCSCDKKEQFETQPAWQENQV